MASITECLANPATNPGGAVPEPGEARLYLCRPDSLDIRERGLFLSWLDREELVRYRRFPSSVARDLFAAAHGLTRFALSHWTACHGDGMAADARAPSPAQWRFRSGSLGKPSAFLTDESDVAIPEFSLSHTKGATVVALVRQARIGVDIENNLRRPKLPELARRFFAPEECEDVLSRPDEQERRRRFLLYWTLKEAYLKALGLGITRTLGSFAFAPGPERANLLYDREEKNDRWDFLHYEMPKGYTLSVAVEESMRPTKRRVRALTVDSGKLVEMVV